MANATITKSRPFENSAGIITMRLRNYNDGGTPIVAADLTSITMRSKTLANSADQVGTLVVPTGEDPDTYTGTSLNPSDVILSSLNTGYLAQGDDTGINFVHRLDGSYWPEGGVTYRVEYKFTPTIGSYWYEVFEITAQNVVSE